MTDSSSGIEPSRSRLWEFLRDRQDQIIGDWKARMRALSPTRDLSDAAIIDHLPQILTRIAAIVESVHAGKAASLGSLAKDHAVDRLARGFDLDQLVTEYSLLRRSIMDLWQARAVRVWKAYLRLAMALASAIGAAVLTAQYFIVLPLFALLARRAANRDPPGFVRTRSAPALESQY